MANPKLTGLIRMAKKRSEIGSLPSYKKPPVIEVVCGITFERLAQFKAPHAGLLWERLRREFPACEHAPRLGLSLDTIDLAVGFPLPRIWFINKGEDRLIQLQDDRFLYNWRKRKDDDVYPRYKNVVSEFKKHLKIFEDFLKNSDLGVVTPLECELTYVNHIPKGEGWESVADIHKILPDLDWRAEGSRFLPEPTTVTGKMTFELPNDRGLLNVKLQPATRKIDNVPVLVLELSAHGLGGDKSPNGVWEWFELAHEWIVRGFADLTSLKVQNTIWKRDDNARTTR